MLCLAQRVTLPAGFSVLDLFYYYLLESLSLIIGDLITVIRPSVTQYNANKISTKSILGRPSYLTHTFRNYCVFLPGTTTKCFYSYYNQMPHFIAYQEQVLRSV